MEFKSTGTPFWRLVTTRLVDQGVVEQAATLQQAHDALGGRLDYLLNVLVR